MPEYRNRTIEPLIDDLLTELPGLLLVGPRATGKTTTAARHVKTIVPLDRPNEAAAFHADPDAALAGLSEPVLIDEWQAVPEVLGAVKRSIDADPHPGRFLLTGSVRADLETVSWPGTGRLIRVAMYPMTIAEQFGRPGTEPLLDRLVRGAELEVPDHPPDLRGYVELALRGGFPEAALALSEGARRRWLESYVDQILTHDIEMLEEHRDPVRLKRYFEACALHTAGLVEHKTLYDAAGIKRNTAVEYDRLLTNLMMIIPLPAWSSNRLRRLVQSPKRYLIDPALVSGALHVEPSAILRDGDLLGRLIDTFVLSQLRAELDVTEIRPRLYHLRMEQGRHEVDVIAEYGARNVIGIEIKADSAPDRNDARHLIWLRGELGKSFVAGVVLHTGTRVYSLADDIIAAPICTLWA
jgi:predicted AAA+ superfamily ATPase